MKYQNQRVALEAAAKLVEELPTGTPFGVTVTDVPDDAELTIYVRSYDDRLFLMSVLNLTHLIPIAFDEQFITYQIGPLNVSIMLYEEEDNV